VKNVNLPNMTPESEVTYGSRSDTFCSSIPGRLFQTVEGKGRLRQLTEIVCSPRRRCARQPTNKSLDCQRWRYGIALVFVTAQRRRHGGCALEIRKKRSMPHPRIAIAHRQESIAGRFSVA